MWRYYLCIFLALILVNFGVVALYYGMVNVAFSDTTGTVSGYIPHSDGPLSKIFIDFTSDDGEDTEFAASVFNIERYKVGQQVAIFYNPFNPHDAHLRIYTNRFEPWIAPLLLFSMGFLIVCWGKWNYAFPVKSIQKKSLPASSQTKAPSVPSTDTEVTEIGEATTQDER